MNGALYSIRKLIAVLIIAVFFIGVRPNGAQQHNVLDEENCRLNAFIASDSHIEGNQPERLSNFGRMLRDIKNTKTQNDAVVLLGDNTMNGQNIESMLFYGALSNISPAKQTIVALGNHDVGNGEGDFNELSQRYYAYNNMFFDAGLSKPYFYKIINGYYFIVLGTESSTSNSFDMSDEQLGFLKETLKIATADGKPVFIFSHYPFEFITGANRLAVPLLLSTYKNVFYIYGHMHAALNPGSVQRYNTIHTVSVPMFTSINANDETGEDRGVGFALEVYDNKVVLRARDCYDGKWLDNYSYSFPIEK